MYVSMYLAITIVSAQDTTMKPTLLVPARRLGALFMLVYGELLSSSRPLQLPPLGLLPRVTTKEEKEVRLVLGMMLRRKGQFSQ